MSEKISDHYDVIIIGCGIAGSAAGAILSSKEGKKVLVLERASQIGGRTISFRGEGIKDLRRYQKDLGLAANTWVSERTKPELSEIIEKGMLNGYILESGARAGWYTNRGRVSYLMAAFNKPTIFYPNVGFVWFDHDWKPHNVARKKPYGWMSEEDNAQTKKISRRFFTTPTIKSAEKYDRVSLKDWIAEITDNPMATEFYNNVGTFHTVVNDPAMISAGENIKVVLQSAVAGVHLTNGAWAFAGAPGHRFIVDGLADVIRDHGGQIETNARVREVSVQNGRVQGVVAELNGDAKEIKAPVIISTLPPKKVFDIIPQDLLRVDFTEALKKTINAGVVTAWLGLKKPITSFCAVEIDHRSFLAAPILVPKSEGFRGHVPIVGGSVSSMAPTLAPEGKHLGLFAMNILNEEAHDKNKVDRVIDRTLEFLDTAFPGYRSELEWQIFTITDTALCWAHPEDKKLDIVCPSVEGLYFAGDAYGKECNSGGIEAASHSGIVCAGAVTGKSYLDMLPEILR